MSAQWATGDRPLLGPDDRAIPGNWFDWRPDRQPRLSATVATTDDYARNTDSQRRAPGDHSAQLVAGTDVAGAGTPAPVTPMPATPAPVGSGVPYGNGVPAMTAPPSGNAGQYRAPSSGYSTPDLSPSGTVATPPATMPGSAPAGSHPTWPPASTVPGGTVPSPSTGGAAPAGTAPGSSAPASPTPTPAPTGSSPSGTSPSNPPPGYFPSGGFHYDNRDGSNRPSPGGTWITPTGVAVAPVSLDGAMVSAPPGTTAGAGLEAGPSIVRIPTTVANGSTLTAVSAEMSTSPAP